MTKNVIRFIEANKTHKVVSGEAKMVGGGWYTLSNGERFSFTLEEMRSLPPLDWGF